MTAQYGIYRVVIGTNAGKPQFVAITDGQNVQFLNTDYALSQDLDYENQDDETKPIFQVRIDKFLQQVPDNSDPAEMLERLNYNQPFSLQLSDPYPSMDEAVSAAQQAVQDLNQEQA